MTKIIEVVKSYVVSPWQDVEKYAGSGYSNLHGAKIVPFAFIQRKLVSVAVFRKDRQGATAAIKRAVRTLIERGDLQEVSRATMTKDYGTSSLAYMISNLHSFGL